MKLKAVFYLRKKKTLWQCLLNSHSVHLICSPWLQQSICPTLSSHVVNKVKELIQKKQTNVKILLLISSSSSAVTEHTHFEGNQAVSYDSQVYQHSQATQHSNILQKVCSNTLKYSIPLKIRLEAKLQPDPYQWETSSELSANSSPSRLWDPCESCYKSNASYVIILTHNFRGRCWRYGSRG